MIDPDLSKQARILSLHLNGETSEAERAELERRLLVDDHYFQTLLAAETELLDHFQEGTLRGPEKQTVSDLLDLSDSLRSRARLGAHFAHVAREQQSSVVTSGPASGRTIKAVLGLTLGALILLNGWQFYTARLQAKAHAAAVAQLQDTVSRQQAALTRRENEVLKLQQDLARQQLLNAEQTD